MATSEKDPKLTRQAMMVLSLLALTPEGLSGSVLASLSSLATGTLYPILLRLEAAGWVKRDADGLRRYWVTSLGFSKAIKETMAWKPILERFDRSGAKK